MSVVLVGCGTGEPNLSSTDQENVVMSPTSHDFGSLQVGQMSGLFTESINPSGYSYDTVDSITENCPDFYIDAPGLPTDVYKECITTCVGICPTPASNVICSSIDYVNYSFSTWFTPSIPGTQSCVVTVSLNNHTASNTFTLYGTGTPPPIDIDVQPTSIAFGDVRVGTSSSPASLAVRNLGGSTLTVSNVTLTGPYALSGPTSFTVAPNGGVQGLSVTCSPTAAGGASGNVKITSNDPATPTITVPLSCTGIVSTLGISPSPAVFPTTRVGEPRSLTIMVTNSGGASTTLQTVSVTGAGITLTSAPAANTVLASGSSVPVTVAFDATTPGAATGTLTATTTDGMRTAQLTAMAQVASMSLTPDGAVDFGPVCVGQSGTQTFTVLGNGDGAFKLTGIETPAAPFTLTAPTLPVTVQGSGASMTTFSVDVAPTAAGPLASAMVISTDIPSGEPHTINLTATALAAGVSATPAGLDLGAIAIDQTTIGQALAITNCTTGAVTWSNARIEGANATDFAIVSQPTGTSIDPTQSGEWLVVLTPHSEGTKTAEFAVDYDGGTVRAPLTGDGLSDTPTPGGTGGDTPSYYTCSTGTARGSWPLALAFVLVLRRRRGARGRR